MQNNQTKIWNAWAFYDWANSVYSLVISSSIFPLYFGYLFTKEHPDLLFLGMKIKATALISFVTAFAFLTISVISPILSGVADYLGTKKRFMQFFCYLGCLSCIGMYFFTKENIYVGIASFYFGLVGFWGSLVYYNSYLVDIAPKEKHDSLSAKGFSFGYLGSVVLLLICLFIILSKNGEEALYAMRFSFILTGIWWFIFSQYTFYYLPFIPTKKSFNKKILKHGFQELRKVKIELFGNAKIKNYLTAFFVYSMAVQTVMLVATYYGEQEINWGKDADAKTKGLIVSILLIQLIAIFGAILTSKLSEKFGNYKILIIINIIWVFICIWAYFIKEPIEFYSIAGFVGLVMGGIQSLSRSTFSKLIPQTNDTTSYFSFYDVTEKIGIVIGMSIYASIDQITGSMRHAILFLVMFFIIGVIILWRGLKIKNL